MKKNFKFFGIIWLVGFVLFNAITFLIPNEILGVTRFDKPVFWIAYALIVLSFIIEGITAYKFVNEDSKEKTFLNLPLISTGYAAIIVSFIVGIIFMVFPVLPTWVGAIVCLLIAGYFVIACVKASTVAELVSEIDVKIKTQTSFIRLAIVESQTIMERAQTVEIKAETKKVYEALRYSDPMSNPNLSSVEQDIDKNLRELKKAVDSNDIAKVQEIARELDLLIKERNSKCKLLK